MRASFRARADDKSASTPRRCAPNRRRYLAWEIATNESIVKRDLDLAERLATRATAAGKEAIPDHLDTLARVQFEKRQFARALETQTTAVTLAGEKAADDMKQALDRYKAAAAETGQ